MTIMLMHQARTKRKTLDVELADLRSVAEPPVSVTKPGQHPLWAYRMGRNPHNPQRGRNPFAERART